MPQQDADEDTDIEALLHHQASNNDTYYQIELSVWEEYLRIATTEWLTSNWSFLGGNCRKVCTKFRIDIDFADDLRQDCAIQAYVHCKTYDPNKGEFDSYMKCYFIKYPRRPDIIKKYTRGIGSNDENTLEEIIAKEEITSEPIQSADIIGQLAPAEQQFLKYRYLDNLSNCAIGRLMGVTEGTVRYNLKQILGKLKIKG